MTERLLAVRDAKMRRGLNVQAFDGKKTFSWWGEVWQRFFQQKTNTVAALILLLLIALSVLAPLISPYDPIEQFRREGLTELGAPMPPNAKFWLGTDGVGRDLLSRILWGGRMSLGIGLAASGTAVIVALLIGGVSGYIGGTADFFIMRFVDLVMSFPTFFLMLLLVTMLRPGVWVVIVVIAVFAWAYPARIFRATMLSIKEQDFVQAAHASGVQDHRIFVQHLLPHLLPLVIVYTALSIPNTIFAEASLSFLGLGVPPPNPSWGSMIKDGMNYYRVAPWVTLYPGVAIALTVISTNLVGAGLREAMDPTQRN
ncbi:ABC transporter permease [Chloroflexi bacterium TSY]|nr:ABC transporter permease [Chloroflexi bacterium TSY]